MEIVKNDIYYLNKMLTYINLIFKYASKIKQNNSTYKPNDQDSDGVVYKFIQLKEESSKLSKSLLLNNPFLNQIITLLSGFRNRLTHDYENVTYSFFEEIIENDLPILKNETIRIIDNLMKK